MTLRSYDAPTLTLVVNPAAGQGKARKDLPAVCSTLLTGLPGAHLRVFQTSDYAEARLRCIQAVEHARPATPGRRRDALLVMGGDGMMTLGLNACATTEVPLGLIPAGTGNDFARGIGLPTLSATAAAKVVVTGHERRMDLMRVSGDLADGARERYVGSVVSTGFDARVNARTNQMRWPRGALRYGVAALAELSRFEPLRYRLKIDGRPRQQDAMFVAVGNAGYFGGGMRVLPHYQVNDGMLDVTIVHPVSRATLLRLLPTMYTGAFAQDPAVELLRARVVEVDGDRLLGMADGEHLGRVPLRMEAVPHALTVFTRSPAPAAVTAA